MTPDCGLVSTDSKDWVHDCCTGFLPIGPSDVEQVSLKSWVDLEEMRPVESSAGAAGIPDGEHKADSDFW